MHMCVCVCGVMTANPQCDSHTHTIKTSLPQATLLMNRERWRDEGGGGGIKVEIRCRPHCLKRTQRSDRAHRLELGMWKISRTERSAGRPMTGSSCVMEGSQRYTLVIIIYPASACCLRACIIMRACRLDGPVVAC